MWGGIAPRSSMSGAPSDETSPALAKGPGSELLLAYELVEKDSPPVVAVRTVTVK